MIAPRPMFTDGVNSLGHALSGAYAVVYPGFAVLFVGYQALQGGVNDLTVDIWEFAVGAMLFVFLK